MTVPSEREAVELRGEPVPYITSDAVFPVEHGRGVVELNERILPRLSVNAEYSALLTTCDDPDVLRYVREKLTEARALIKGARTRCDTLLQLLTLIAAEQRDFFCAGGALTPVTMQLAEKLGVSTSTVSRAVQNKYIQFQSRILPIRSFFTTAIRSGAAVSSQAVKHRIRGLIQAEVPAAPLSDKALRCSLKFSSRLQKSLADRIPAVSVSKQLTDFQTLRSEPADRNGCAFYSS